MLKLNTIFRVARYPSHYLDLNSFPKYKKPCLKNNYLMIKPKGIRYYDHFRYISWYLTQLMRFWIPPLYEVLNCFKTTKQTQVSWISKCFLHSVRLEKHNQWELWSDISKVTLFSKSYQFSALLADREFRLPFAKPWISCVFMTQEWVQYSRFCLG